MRTATAKLVGFMAVALSSVWATCDSPAALQPESPPIPHAPPIRKALSPTPASKLLASDGAAHDEFGRFLATDGSFALIGAPNHARPLPLFGQPGAAYVFQQIGSGWVEEAVLFPSDGRTGDIFGHAVAISDQLAIVGAPNDDDLGLNSGTAFVFRRTAGGWVEEAKLLASDGAADRSFGHAVGISGERAVVGSIQAGAVGAAYVFRNSAIGWGEETKLVPSDPPTGDYGVKVSLSGDRAIVGDPAQNDAGAFSGAAYIFRDTGAGWVQEVKLLASDAKALDVFGSDVFISGDLAIVGAPDGGSGSLPGAAYIFRNHGGVWLEEAKLTPSDGAPQDKFGFRVSISGAQELAIVGAFQDDDGGPDSGSAYVYRNTAAGWVQEAKLTAPDGAAGDEFGISVSVSDQQQTILVGARRDDDLGTDSGSAYTFILTPEAQIELVTSSVDELVASGVLSQGLGASLISKLDTALRLLARNDEAGATAVLMAFIHDVEALVAAGKLSSAEGQALMDSVQDVIDQLGG